MEQKKQAVGQAIRELRLEAGMTQTQFAKAVGVTLNKVRGWEQGTSIFLLQDLFAICEALHRNPVEVTRRFRDACEDKAKLGVI